MKNFVALPNPAHWLTPPGTPSCTSAPPVGQILNVPRPRSLLAFSALVLLPSTLSLCKFAPRLAAVVNFSLSTITFVSLVSVRCQTASRSSLRRLILFSWQSESLRHRFLARAAAARLMGF